MGILHLHTYKYLKRIAVAGVLLTLWGCEANRVNMRPALDHWTPVPAEEGVVVARIIDITDKTLPFNQLTLVPENVNASKEEKFERLLAVTPRPDTSSVFASSVPPGKYAINSVRTYFSSNQWWYDKAEWPEANLGTFEVKPGQITDLGTLVVYPKVNGERYNTIIFRLNDYPAVDALTTYLPFYKHNPEFTNTWDEDGLESDRLDTYIGAAQNPISFADTYTNAQGTTYFPSPLGIMMVRDNQGQWSLDAVETHYTLTAIAENSVGDLFVGSEEGQVFWRKQNSPWQEVFLAPGLNIEKLYFDNENEITAVASGIDSIEVYRGSVTDANFSWKKINAFNTSTGWENNPNDPDYPATSIPRAILKARFYEYDGESFLTLTSIKNAGDLIPNNTKNEYFQYDPSSWKVPKLDKQPQLSSVVQAGNQKLGIKQPGFWSFSQKPDYLRYDEATQSWSEMAKGVYCPAWGEEFDEKTHGDICRKETAPATSAKKTIKSFDLISVPWFIDSKTGVALVNFRKNNAWTGESSNTFKMVETNNGGASWSLTSRELPKPYCFDIVNDVQDTLLLSCNGATGDFYKSDDLGKSWKHVREHQNL